MESDVSTVTIGVGGVETGERVHLVAQPLRLAAAGDGGRRYQAVFVTAGRVKRRDGGQSAWVISPEALEKSTARFAEVAVFVDHPGFLDSGRKVRDLAGVTERDVVFDPASGELRGVIRFYNEEGAGAMASALFDQLLADQQAGRETPDVGLSAVFWHRYEIDERTGDRITTEFSHVESVDVVFGPGAKGAVRAALQAVQAGATEAPIGGNMDKDNLVQTPAGGGDGAPPVTAPPVTPPPAPAQQGLTFGGLSPQQVASLQATYQESQNLLVGQCEAYLEAQITMLTGQLPQPSLDHLRKQFGNRVFSTAELEAAVENQRNLVATLTQGNVVRGMGLTRGNMMNEIDQVTLAYEKLMGLEVSEPVFPLTGIKDLYIRLTGDRQMRGLFNPDYAELATDSSTMAEVTRNVLNKVMLAQWMALGEAGYNWWQKIAHMEDFLTIQDISWICTDGFGDLSTVTEGSAYGEITWDDARETATFLKKGGYVGLTLEMIDKDDVQAWRAVPRGLATAGIRTLSAAVAALFTDNDGTGPALNDTHNLFDATNHSNLITHALDPDNWDEAVKTMFKQTEQGSSKRLGIRPKYLLVSVDNEKRGRQVLGSGVEPTSGVFYENVRQQAVDNVITVPEWTDADNWACAADPVIAPGVGIGFRYGRVPEIFTVVDPRMGLMFTNDILPIKVRFFYAVGIINYRALVKSNV